MDETLNRILSLLKERNIAKGKFLADLNFDRSALSEWVKGRHKSYMKRLPEIAAYFNVSLDWLAGIEQKNKAHRIDFRWALSRSRIGAASCLFELDNIIIILYCQ